MIEQPVKEMFDLALRAQPDASVCVIALPLARRAAAEHDRAAGPMFQSWHPSMVFHVAPNAPPDMLYLVATIAEE